MKQMKELIKRLRYDRDDGARDEAADALEAADKRIAELEDEITFLKESRP